MSLQAMIRLGLSVPRHAVASGPTTRPAERVGGGSSLVAAGRGGYGREAGGGEAGSIAGGGPQ